MHISLGPMMLSATLAALLGTAAHASEAKPTIVLVHGAFAESSSWNGVIAELNRHGYRTIAAANPLRGVASDAAAVSTIIGSVSGPVILVGHSYGGPVITAAADGKSNIKALVYVAAFAPEAGESSLTLSSKFPGSTLGEALLDVPLPEGGLDLYVQPSLFHQQFAADLPSDIAGLMAATQRPVAAAALAEPSGPPSWKAIPNYAIYGLADRNIPPAVLKFMAERSNSLKTVAIAGASHALMVSHPHEVASLIEEAAAAR